MSKNIIVRFAPSPTGFLHIGGARTALFNWVFAQHHNGKMLLRIEDTDEKRSTDQAIKAIIDGLQWLKISWDEQIVYQKSRSARHSEIAHKLVELGKAYYCYTSAEEITSNRENAQKNGENFCFRSIWREPNGLTPPKGIKPVIRLKTPEEGFTEIADIVQGKINFPNKDLEDLVLLRANGLPTYMLAVVVDDYDMQVSHIIRGDDHLTNTAKQKLIYDALGWQMPLCAHIPLIHGEDGAKLSKRHGALGVEEYQKMGYLPDAIKNYLMRLGWSHGNEEIMPMQEIIKHFSLEKVNKAPSRFDFNKLNFFNANYIKNMPPQELFDYLVKEIAILQEQTILKNVENLPQKISTDYKEVILRALPIFQQRAKTLIEILDMCGFIINYNDINFEEKSQILLEQTDKNLIEQLNSQFARIEEWQKPQLKEMMDNFLEQNQLKLSAIAPNLRSILTKSANNLGLLDVLIILGKKETLQRIESFFKEFT